MNALSWLKSCVAAPLALIGVFGFFLGLGWIIQAPDGEASRSAERISLNWAELPPEPELETLRPPPPPPPPEITEPAQTSPSQAAAPQASALDSDFVLDTPQPDLNFNLGTGDLPELNPNLSLAAAVPVYREHPQYPRQALARRIQGWVDLVFEVDAEGQVLPETIRVVAAEPEGIFDRAARRAIARWRFSTDELGSQGAQLRQRMEFRLEGNG